MERMRKQGSESGNLQRTAQGKFASRMRAGDFERSIAGSPAMVAQRRKLQGLFGAAFPVQRAEDGLRRVSLKQLSDEDAHKHLAESFKKGKMEEPLVNASGGLVQRTPKKQSWNGGDLFTVLDSDLGTGTGTSEGTRNYVNDPGTDKPDSILFDYATNKNTAKASQAVKGNKYAYETENPEADRSYKSGRHWDAGHKLGRQNGGLGDQDDWVFPQNPAFNQGNSRNMDDVEETYPLWRGYENDFHDGVASDGGGVWWIKLV